MEIPEADPWFCEACLEDRKDEEPNNVKNTCNEDLDVTQASSEVQVDDQIGALTRFCSFHIFLMNHL